MADFQQSQLANGLKVVTESTDSHAICMGLGFYNGSFDDPKSLEGISHFLEHLVFKGTKARDAKAISWDIEKLGGEINAYTSREMTCYYCHLLKEDLEQGLDVLLDLGFSPLLRKEDIQAERKVIAQEIRMTKDSPEEWVFDLYFEKAYQPGTSILGSFHSLKQLNDKNIRKFYQQHYHPTNAILVISGGVSHKEVLRTLSKYKLGKKQKIPQKINIQTNKAFCKIKTSQTEQAQLILGFPVPSMGEGLQYEASLWACFLGQGGHSLLYQELREKLALCYSVYSVYMPTDRSGDFLSYVATDPGKIALSARKILQYYSSLSHYLDESAFLALKKLWISSALLGKDDLEARMNQILNDLFLGRNYRSLEDSILAVEKVSLKDMHDYAKAYFKKRNLNLYALGKFNDKQKKQIQHEYKAWIS